MITFLVAFALLLHVLFWGAGLAILAMPRPWRRFWPVVVPLVGFVLQSTVVWLGAYANLHGTNAYAWPAEIIPVVLLAAGIRRHGLLRCRNDVARFGLVWLVMGSALVLLAFPLAFAARGLTSVSLGSCDAADYAAGARVFMEFAHSDRGGFMGLTDVVRVMSVDNFFDFWLRLNHFTPSALIALNGSVLHCAPHELTSLLTAVVLAASIPTVFWMARALFGYTGAASLAIATLYGLSPIPWYSFAQVSPAPLLAAQAIAWLTWASVALWNGLLTRRRILELAGILALAYALILGSYNFILLVCLAPAAAYVVIRASQSDAWNRLGRWAVAVVAPLVLCSIVYWARAAGLVERFLLFRTYDFGWRIPALAPDGWLGLVQGGGLHPWSWLGIRWIFIVVVVIALGWGMLRGLRTGGRRIWLVIASVLPVLLGYYFLEGRGVLLGTNASYDAFKLFAVFYPVLLPAFCWWITLRWSTRLVQWFAVVGMAMAVFALNSLACLMFIVELSRPPLIVDGELRQVRRVEAMKDIDSVNLLIPDMWSRLWANEFLLRKPQYFLTHTYEGRLNTPLRGDWDLGGGVVRVQPAASGYREITTHYWLADARAADFVRAVLGDGWYPEERLRNGERWQWTSDGATIVVDNPHAYPLTLKATLDGRGIDMRDIALASADEPNLAYVRISDQRQTLVLPSLRIPPGRTVLVLRSKQGSQRVEGDERSLAVCVFRLTFRTQRD